MKLIRIERELPLPHAGQGRGEGGCQVASARTTLIPAFSRVREKEPGRRAFHASRVARGTVEPLS
jgi:hypothetical protein